MQQVDGILGFITSRMTWLTQRQKVLAENIANADTPRFEPKDLSQPNFANELRAVSNHVRATHVGHISTGADFGNGVTVVKARGGTGALSGNQVDLESEMMKVSTTVVDYQAMTALLKKWQGLFRTAIGRA